MNEEQIKELIESELEGAEVQISGDGRHFEALIVYEGFSGKSILQQHRMVYAVFGDKFSTDEVHALSIKTMTPDQYAGTQQG